MLRLFLCFSIYCISVSQSVTMVEIIPVGPVAYVSETTKHSVMKTERKTSWLCMYVNLGVHLPAHAGCTVGIGIAVCVLAVQNFDLKREPDFPFLRS